MEDERFEAVVDGSQRKNVQYPEPASKCEGNFTSGETAMTAALDPGWNTGLNLGRIAPEIAPVVITLNADHKQGIYIEENDVQDVYDFVSKEDHWQHPRQARYSQDYQQNCTLGRPLKVHHQDHTHDCLPDHNKSNPHQIHLADCRQNCVLEDPKQDHDREHGNPENNREETKESTDVFTEPAPVASSLPGTKMAARRVTFLSSPELLRLCDRMPRVPGRASMVQSLIWAYGLPQYMTTVPGRLATEEELLAFHSLDYLSFLRRVGKAAEDNDLDSCSELAESFGLSYDCPVQEDVYDCSALVAGATIAGAEALVAGQCDVAINWFGGWHHAQKESASGFCYINDIVLGILKLRTKFQRVLYIDLDLHHGDGVEDAFSYTPRVMTVSFHKYGPGFFPGTGSCYSNGVGKGRHYTINVPLEDGAQDAEYVMMFRKVLGQVREAYKPDAIVCQCGADGLAGDPMETFNLTPLSLLQCVGLLLSWRLPTLLLGGGGYNHVNTAKCWAQLTALAVGKKLPVDIPDHQFYMSYGPDYELTVSEGNRKNCNSRTQLEALLQRISRNLEQIRT